MNRTRVHWNQFLEANSGVPSVFPEDLRKMAPDADLAFFALDAAQRVKESALSRGLQFRSSDSVLLTLLTYCYAAGIYGSQEIERQSAQDRTVRYLCANGLIDWNSILLFRRRSHRLVRESLSELFRTIAEWSPAHQAEDYRSFLCEIEAENRLRKAIQTDSNTMDD